jgi:hypothetical protein
MNVAQLVEYLDLALRVPAGIVVNPNTDGSRYLHSDPARYLTDAETAALILEPFGMITRTHPEWAETCAAWNGIGHRVYQRLTETGWEQQPQFSLEYERVRPTWSGGRTTYLTSPTGAGVGTNGHIVVPLDRAPPLPSDPENRLEGLAWNDVASAVNDQGPRINGSLIALAYPANAAKDDTTAVIQWADGSVSFANALYLSVGAASVRANLEQAHYACDSKTPASVVEWTSTANKARVLTGEAKTRSPVIHVNGAKKDHEAHVMTLRGNAWAMAWNNTRHRLDALAAAQAKADAEAKAAEEKKRRKNDPNAKIEDAWTRALEKLTKTIRWRDNLSGGVGTMRTGTAREWLDWIAAGPMPVVVFEKRTGPNGSIIECRISPNDNDTSWVSGSSYEAAYLLSKGARPFGWGFRGRVAMPEDVYQKLVSLIPPALRGAVRPRELPAELPPPSPAPVASTPAPTPEPPMTSSPPRVIPAPTTPIQPLAPPPYADGRADHEVAQGTRELWRTIGPIWARAFARMGLQPATGPQGLLVTPRDLDARTVEFGFKALSGQVMGVRLRLGLDDEYRLQAYAQARSGNELTWGDLKGQGIPLENLDEPGLFMRREGILPVRGTLLAAEDLAPNPEDRTLGSRMHPVVRALLDLDRLDAPLFVRNGDAWEPMEVVQTATAAGPAISFTQLYDNGDVDLQVIVPFHNSPHGWIINSQSKGAVLIGMQQRRFVNETGPRARELVDVWFRNFFEQGYDKAILAEARRRAQDLDARNAAVAPAVSRAKSAPKPEATGPAWINDISNTALAGKVREMLAGGTTVVSDEDLDELGAVDAPSMRWLVSLPNPGRMGIRDAYVAFLKDRVTPAALQEAGVSLPPEGPRAPEVVTPPVVEHPSLETFLAELDAAVKRSELRADTLKALRALLSDPTNGAVARAALEQILADIASDAAVQRRRDAAHAALRRAGITDPTEDSIHTFWQGYVAQTLLAGQDPGARLDDDAFAAGYFAGSNVFSWDGAAARSPRAVELPTALRDAVDQLTAHLLASPRVSTVRQLKARIERLADGLDTLLRHPVVAEALGEADAFLEGTDEGDGEDPRRSPGVHDDPVDTSHVPDQPAPIEPVPDDVTLPEEAPEGPEEDASDEPSVNTVLAEVSAYASVMQKLAPGAQVYLVRSWARGIPGADVDLVVVLPDAGHYASMKVRQRAIKDIEYMARTTPVVSMVAPDGTTRDIPVDLVFADAQELDKWPERVLIRPGLVPNVPQGASPGTNPTPPAGWDVDRSDTTGLEWTDRIRDLTLTVDLQGDRAHGKFYGERGLIWDARGPRASVLAAARQAAEDGLDARPPLGLVPFTTQGRGPGATLLASLGVGARAYLKDDTAITFERMAAPEEVHRGRISVDSNVWRSSHPRVGTIASNDLGEVVVTYIGRTDGVEAPEGGTTPTATGPDVRSFLAGIARQAESVYGGASFDVQADGSDAIFRFKQHTQAASSPLYRSLIGGMQDRGYTARFTATGTIMFTRGSDQPPAPAPTTPDPDESVSGGAMVLPLHPVTLTLSLSQKSGPVPGKKPIRTSLPPEVAAYAHYGIERSALALLLKMGWKNATARGAHDLWLTPPDNTGGLSSVRIPNLQMPTPAEFEAWAHQLHAYFMADPSRVGATTPWHAPARLLQVKGGKMVDTGPSPHAAAGRVPGSPVLSWIYSAPWTEKVTTVLQGLMGGAREEQTYNHDHPAEVSLRHPGGSWSVRWVGGKVHVRAEDERGARYTYEDNAVPAPAHVPAAPAVPTVPAARASEDDDEGGEGTTWDTPRGPISVKLNRVGKRGDAWNNVTANSGPGDRRWSYGYAPKLKRWARSEVPPQWVRDELIQHGMGQHFALTSEGLPTARTPVTETPTSDGGALMERLALAGPTPRQMDAATTACDRAYMRGCRLVDAGMRGETAYLSFEHQGRPVEVRVSPDGHVL